MTSAIMGRISPSPPGGDRFKVENLGATAVSLVAPVDTSLFVIGEPDQNKKKYSNLI